MGIPSDHMGIQLGCMKGQQDSILEDQLPVAEQQERCPAGQHPWWFLSASTLRYSVLFPHYRSMFFITFKCWNNLGLKNYCLLDLIS